MRFLPEPESVPFGPAPEHHAWRWLLYASAAAAAFAATLPWVCVRFPRLYGEVLGPPGWQTSAGFTCFCTCLLVCVLTMAETPTVTARTAVRPGSLLIVAVAAFSILLTMWDGPGWVRGATARWTWAFVLAAVCVPMLLVACFVRWAAMRQRRV
ncbi:MAG TPA: hypothetical protein VF384_19940 [Planctomycetota bacterium]